MPGEKMPRARVRDANELNINELFQRLNTLALRSTTVLPKIVIIGDKSSGKTSIFEALTGLPFPAEKRPLTNFAIHALFKRTTDEKAYARARIEPGPIDGQYQAASEHLAGFDLHHDGPLTTQSFANILYEAAAHMDVSITDPDAAGNDGQDVGERQLSDNMLVVEIVGPDVHNFSIIDFPGIMHNYALYSSREIEAVKSLVVGHIKEPHTIILAAVDATNQISNQEALQLAQTVDPGGHRTVGVLTKCDLVQKGDENRILRIFGNKEHRLHQGWFAIKNRSMGERRDGDNLEKRNANEALFFQQEPWNQLSHSRVGVAPLRDFLADLVNSILQDSINMLMQKIQTMTESRASSHFTGPAQEVTDGKDSNDELRLVSEPLPDSNDSQSLENSDLETGTIKKRKTVLINACTVSVTIAMVLTLVGLGCQQLAQEIATDGNWYRLFLLFTAPLQIFVSLFFCQAIIGTFVQILGPVSQLRTNSKYYSAYTVKRLNIANGPLPHVTIQCPVYKEGLDAVIRPTVQSLDAAIHNYKLHGGTVNLFFNDDGMQLLSPEEAAERQAFYKEHDIGWVARPKHNPRGEGLERFIRRGKFKKASNMNYGLGISLKVEDKLVEVDRDGAWTQNEEDQAYQRCLAEVLDEELGRAWADGNIRVGDYILIVDSDTRIPEECLIDAISEMEESPEVAILQFSSGVMNVTTSYFERGITFFTDLIYTAIRFAVASGDVSPFVGHNAFLRWSALQEVSFQEEENGHHGEEKLKPGEKDPNSTTPYEKFWSESHVSEDFDISLRLQTMGYHVRLGAYCGEDFKEGVSLTVYDELARWEKYAYGCNELLFHPAKLWWKRGIITPLCRRFLTSCMPLGSKVTIIAYIGTYYAIGYAWLGTLLNYFLMGWVNGHIDHYYMNSWRIWVALMAVFSGGGNLSLAILRYRGEGRNLINQLWICSRWVPLLFIFLGGISMHVSQALLSHMFSIELSWGATAKEVTDTSFFIEMPIIARRFKFAFIFSIGMIAMLICGVYAFPYLWRINQLIAIFPVICVASSHFLLPVLLNPALMKFTW